MQLTDQEFNFIVDFVKKHAGIELKDKRVLITGRLENFLVSNGYESYSEFIQKIGDNGNTEEARLLIDRLTTNHTYFMREFAHFEFLKNTILPEIQKREKNTRDIRIWSAASSTGEEPYTIEMILQDYFCMENPKWDTTILATDISYNVLSHCVKGIYLTEQIQVLPETWQHRYFRRFDETHSKVSDALRNGVEFRQFNLMDPFPFKNKFQVIFLRNVMIYFDNDTKDKLIKKMEDALEPGGYLIIGSTEALDRSRTGLSYVKPSIYRKKL